MTIEAKFNPDHKLFTNCGWQVRDPGTGKFGLSEATQIDLQVLRNNSRLFR